MLGLQKNTQRNNSCKTIINIHVIIKVSIKKIQSLQIFKHNLGHAMVDTANDID